jgi:UDP-N-acetylglucosamine 4-epimerase
VNELYADVFARTYGFNSIGLRYFNVFGKRQDPNGAYAAVIPRWILAMLSKEPIFINGDGQTSRDFCHVNNAIEANLLAVVAEDFVQNQVYNVAVGDRTSLNELFDFLKLNLLSNQIDYEQKPIFRDFRSGDVRHSQADISKAIRCLGYAPAYRVSEGIAESLPWFISNRSILECSGGKKSNA